MKMAISSRMLIRRRGMALAACPCEAPARDIGSGLPLPRAASAAGAAAGAAEAEAGLGKMAVGCKEAGAEPGDASEACDCEAPASDTGEGPATARRSKAAGAAAGNAFGKMTRITARMLAERLRVVHEAAAGHLRHFLSREAFRRQAQGTR